MLSKIEFKTCVDFSVKLGLEWSYLADLSAVTIFQSYSWQSIWNESINKNNLKNSLFIINVYSNKKIIAILPFERKQSLNFKTLSFTGHPFADYCDCLIDKSFFETNPEVKNTIKNYIFNLKNIDLIFFKNISENNNLYYLFGKYKFKKDSFCSYQLLRKEENINDLIKKKFASDTKRQIKRLSLVGRLSYKIANDISDKNKIFKFFVDNKHKQLADTNNWNYLENNIYKKFLYNLFISNNAHLSSLSLNGQIIAVHMGNYFKKTMLYLFPVYDNNFSKYSPGNILLYELIKDFFSTGGEEFDFTTGDESYKIKLSNIKNNMYYQNIELTYKGKIISKILIILNSFKKINWLRSTYNKLKY